MKVSSMIRSRTVWCGVIVAVIALLRMIAGDSVGDVSLDEVEKNKEVIGSNFVLIAQGLAGVGAIIFRIKARDRD